MRITFHIPEPLKKELKITAQNEKKSISAFVTEAVQYHIRDTKRKKYGEKMLSLVGKAKVSPDILRELERERNSNDRS